MKLTVDKEIIIVDALEFIRGEVKEVKITEAPHIKRVYSEHEVKSAMYDSWCSSRDELPQSFDIFYDKWINKK